MSRACDGHVATPLRADRDLWSLLVVVGAEQFPDITDAIAVERQIKRWSRSKKEALIRGDFGALRPLSKRGGNKDLA